MILKYKDFNFFSLATVILCSASFYACNDDFGKNTNTGEYLKFDISVASSWDNGNSSNDTDTRCTSITAVESDCDESLYLHCNESDDNRTISLSTRGELKETIDKFSLSAICYTGTYPANENDNEWFPEFAHNLTFTNNGVPKDGSKQLQWPSGGKIRFFAFSPITDDVNKISDASLNLSGANEKGTPTLTYTVPKEASQQVDLLAACTDATSPDVNLNFRHILTAVNIVAAEDMWPGKISKVTISGIYGSGKYTFYPDKTDDDGNPVGTGGKWEPNGDRTASYTVNTDVTLDENGDPIHTKPDTEIIGPSGNLTFLLMPQELTEGATIEMEFIDNFTNTSHIISASLAGHTWEPGKKIKYSISQSSINISPKITFSKNPYIDENNKGDSIAYSGVWYDAKFTASAEIVQAGEDKGTIETFEADKVKFIYQFEDTETWAECEKDDKGLLKIEAQPHYLKITNQNENGSADKPTSLASGESANCYLIDQAGYYSLPLYYGNLMGKSVPAGHTKGLTYYPNHLNQEITSGEITGAEDAVLCWQDSPDLIDPASVKLDTDKKNLIFHIRKHTLAQGNALLAVRNAAKQIIWSWHIWVTTPSHKTDFDSKRWTSTDGTHSYDLAAYNLGWCDSHETDEARNFRLQAVIDMSAYGGGASEEVEIGTFRQIELKGSDAGDNTYYQWGRKDPMLGGIYNTKTTKYTYTKHPDSGGTKTDKEEFTMENKQVFNQYNREEGHDYSFRKNPGDQIDLNDAASYGVTIGYTIQHPYMFITNSRSNKVDGAPFDYRNHWHIPYGTGTGYFKSPYMNSETHIMFNAWDSGATDANEEHATVTKSVYDPCPPGFKMPPIGAFTGITKSKYPEGKARYSANNTWEIENSAGSTIKFPLTGVRNYALRSNEWQSVSPIPTGFDNQDDFYKMFYKTSMPAFRMLTFISSATIVKPNGTTNAYQVKLFRIDQTNRSIVNSYNNLKIECISSSNSYGLAVRPMFDDQSQTK